MDLTIFSYIDSVLFNKNKLNTINEEESEFNLYMLNRWCSMYSDSMCLICNQLGKYIRVFDNKQDIITFYTAVLPKVPAKKITYFKRKKVEAKDEEEIRNVQLLAAAYEISTREAKEYMAMLNN
mgnify:CR=1 FL=1